MVGQPYVIRPGGLMRCCERSLDAVMQIAGEPPSEGDTTRCRYCKNGMIFRGGAWEWNRPDDSEIYGPADGS